MPSNGQRNILMFPALKLKTKIGILKKKKYIDLGFGLNLIWKLCFYWNDANE